MSNELWVFEISESQRCFHFGPLSQSLRDNLMQSDRFFKGEMTNYESHDYRPLFIGTYEEVDKLIIKYRQHIAEIDHRHAGFGTLERMAEECGV